MLDDVRLERVLRRVRREAGLAHGARAQAGRALGDAGVRKAHGALELMDEEKLYLGWFQGMPKDRSTESRTDTNTICPAKGFFLN